MCRLEREGRAASRVSGVSNKVRFPPQVSGAQAKTTVCPNVNTNTHTHTHLNVERQARGESVPHCYPAKGLGRAQKHKSSTATRMGGKSEECKAQWDSSPRPSLSQCRPRRISARRWS